MKSMGVAGKMHRQDKLPIAKLLKEVVKNHVVSMPDFSIKQKENKAIKDIGKKRTVRGGKW